MSHFPPWPAWESLHPLMIHFPISLLLLSPLFILISTFPKPPKGRPYMVAAIIILILGTASLFIAASTGYEAMLLAKRGGVMHEAIEKHQEVAEVTQIVFAVLAAVLLVMFFVPRILRCEEDRVLSTFVPLAFLAFYSVGILFVLNTAHAGGRIVHEFNIHANAPSTGEQ